jgi:hypothetical protein
MRDRRTLHSRPTPDLLGTFVIGHSLVTARWAFSDPALPLLRPPGTRGRSGAALGPVPGRFFIAFRSPFDRFLGLRLTLNCLPHHRLRNAHPKPMPPQTTFLAHWQLTTGNGPLATVAAGSGRDPIGIRSGSGLDPVWIRFLRQTQPSGLSLTHWKGNAYAGNPRPTMPAHFFTRLSQPLHLPTPSQSPRSLTAAANGEPKRCRATALQRAADARKKASSERMVWSYIRSLICVDKRR